MPSPFDNARTNATDFGGRAYRVVRLQTDRAGPLGNLLFALIALGTLLLFILLLIPILLVGVLAGAVMGLITGAKLLLKRAKLPNGPLDGRKNVRVIDRSNRG